MKSAKINHTKDKTGSSCRLLYATFVKLIGLYLLISLATRIVLLFNEQTQVAFSITEWLQIFLLGAANDLFVGIIWVNYLLGLQMLRNELLANSNLICTTNIDVDPATISFIEQLNRNEAIKLSFNGLVVRPLFFKDAAVR